jgi:hypothetical protein
MQDDRRHPSPSARSASALAPDAQLSPSTLQGALTPRGLFTNLFPVSFGAGNLGTLRQTEKAKKEDFVDRRRPRFYQSGETCYAYGAGLDDFKDSRFTPTILAPATDPYFALHLVKYGLVDLLRGKGYLVRARFVGVSVLDHENPITSAEGFLKILPEYTFQTNLLEGAQGTPIFAVSIDTGWSTVPVFELGPRVAQRADLLENLKLVLECAECDPTCPLHERLGRVVGVFESFAEEGTALTSACRHQDYTPQPVCVRQRVRSAGPRRRDENSAPPAEQMVVVPGQVVKPASGQRQVLRLSKDKNALALEGRIWLGDLTRTRKIRTDGLQVRYEHIQRFLARLANHETRGITFPIETGTKVTLERVPVTTEVMVHG